MKKSRPRCISIKASSGNILADLELPDSIELDTKLRLAATVNRLIAKQGLTHRNAATRLALTQENASSLQNYRLESFSVVSLMNLLLALGQDVEIRIRPRQIRRATGRVVVLAT